MVYRSVAPQALHGLPSYLRLPVRAAMSLGEMVKTISLWLRFTNSKPNQKEDATIIFRTEYRHPCRQALQALLLPWLAVVSDLLL
jgi:hypothetical protein